MGEAGLDHAAVCIVVKELQRHLEDRHSAGGKREHGAPEIEESIGALRFNRADAEASATRHYCQNVLCLRGLRWKQGR